MSVSEAIQAAAIRKPSAPRRAANGQPHWEAGFADFHNQHTVSATKQQLETSSTIQRSIRRADAAIAQLHAARHELRNAIAAGREAAALASNPVPEAEAAVARAKQASEEQEAATVEARAEAEKNVRLVSKFDAALFELGRRDAALKQAEERLTKARKQVELQNQSMARLEAVVAAVSELDLPAEKEAATPPTPREPDAGFVSFGTPKQPRTRRELVG